MENKWTRGSVFYADLGDVKGSEQGGIRPIVLVSNDKNNLYLCHWINNATGTYSEKIDSVPVNTEPCYTHK